LQGFWNLLIYVRPVYKRIRKEHPEYSAKARLMVVLMGKRGHQHRVQGSDEPARPCLCNPNNIHHLSSNNSHKSLPARLSAQEVQTVFVDPSDNPPLQRQQQDLHQYHSAASDQQSCCDRMERHLPGDEFALSSPDFIIEHAPETEPGHVELPTEEEQRLHELEAHEA